MSVWKCRNVLWNSVYVSDTVQTYIYICVCDEKSMKNNIEAHLVGDFPGNEGLVHDRLNLIQVFFVLGQEYSKRKKLWQLTDG